MMKPRSNSPIARLLLWDVGPLLAWLPKRFFRFFVTPKSQAPAAIGHSALWRSRWRSATWWPSDSLATVQRSLLRMLALAHRERLELSTVVWNFADEQRGHRRLRLQRFASRLTSGTPLVEALEQTPDVLRDQDVLALRFASQTGVVSNLYKDLLQESTIDRRLAKAAVNRLVEYALGIAIALGLIATFLAIFITPMIIRLAKDNAIQVPDAIQIPHRNHDWVTGFFLLSVSLGLGVAAIRCSRRIRRSLRWFFSDWQARLGLSPRSAELMRLLSLAAEAGRPISVSLSTLARYHFDRSIRNRLLFIRNEIEQGAEAWNCFFEVRLITEAEADAIRQCIDGKSQAWVLRQFADARDAAVTLRYRKIAAWGQPSVILIGGAVVLWLSSGYFQVLSQLFVELSRWTS